VSGFKATKVWNSEFFSFPFQDSGLYEYKTFGVMDDLDPEICAQVYVDWEYRKVWDTYVLGEVITPWWTFPHHFAACSGKGLHASLCTASIPTANNEKLPSH